MVANYQACKELYDQLFPSGTQTLTDMPRCQQDTFEPERWAQRRWNQRDRMQDSLNEMQAACADLENLVNLVTGNYNTVLIRRYMLNQSYETISEQMNCHRNTIKRWHDGAIEMIIKKDGTA
jgi:DNA-directed RNA polymerase specialized sigma24 family protein